MEETSAPKTNPLGWTYTFSLTVSPPAAASESKSESTRFRVAISRRDLVWMGVAFFLVALEPFLLYSLFSSAPAALTENPGAAVVVRPVETTAHARAPGDSVENPSGNDVITPLNVRDPAALVLGPGR